MKVIDHAPGDKHKRVVVGRWVWLAPPLDRLQEGLTFGVDPLVVAAGILVAGQEIGTIAFAVVDYGPEFEILVEALGAARMLLVAGPADRAHFQDQLIRHPRVVARPAFRHLAP